MLPGIGKDLMRRLSIVEAISGKTIFLVSAYPTGHQFEPGVCPVVKVSSSTKDSSLPASMPQSDVEDGLDSLIVVKGDKPWKRTSMAVTVPAITSTASVPE